MKDIEIIRKIGHAAAFEQLAEECAELGKAALKMARILRAENPTPVTLEDALKNCIEEAGDVVTCLELFEKTHLIHIDDEMRKEKIERWINRIREKRIEQLRKHDDGI